MSRGIRRPATDEVIVAELWLLRRRGDAAARQARRIIAEIHETRDRLSPRERGER